MATSAGRSARQSCRRRRCGGGAVRARARPKLGVFPAGHRSHRTSHAAALLAQVEHPLNYLYMEGRSCKVHRNDDHYNAIEREEGLIPWKPDVLIDRFDGRSMLDFYKDPDPSAWARPKTPQEEKLEQVRRRPPQTGSPSCLSQPHALHVHTL